MLVEAYVLCRYGGVDDVRRKLGIMDECTVLYVIGIKYLAILRDQFGGQLAVRILEFLERRNVGKGPDNKQHQQHKSYRYAAATV